MLVCLTQTERRELQELKNYIFQCVTMISLCVAKGSSFLLTFPDTVIKLRSLTLKRCSGSDSEHLTHAGKSSRAAFIFISMLLWVWIQFWSLFIIWFFISYSLKKLHLFYSLGVKRRRRRRRILFCWTHLKEPVFVTRLLTVCCQPMKWYVITKTVLFLHVCVILIKIKSSWNV